MRTFYSQASACSYLPNETSKMQYILNDDEASPYYEYLLNHGFRRFGSLFFRHNCSHCKKCISLRIPLKNFRFSKNQKRILKKNAEIRPQLCRPQVTPLHLDLYNKYHSFKKENNQWKFEPISEDHYFDSFVSSAFHFGHEIQYYREDTLIGIGYIDILQKNLSSVYFFYDPEWSNLSPGTFSILFEIQLAQEMNLEYYHLGYWIKENQSMQYKARFKPHELLGDRPSLESPANWISTI